MLDTAYGNATIANGASLSDAIDVTNRPPVALVMPAAWTAAPISFDVSHDGGATYKALSDADGEVLVAGAVALVDKHISIDPSPFLGATHLKVRSGIIGTLVAQGAQRLVVVVRRDPG